MIDWFKGLLGIKQSECDLVEAPPYIKDLKYTPLVPWSAIELSPDDVLVLSTEHTFGDGLMKRLKEELKAALPEHMQNHRIIIFQGGLKLNVLKETKND